MAAALRQTERAGRREHCLPRSSLSPRWPPRWKMVVVLGLLSVAATAWPGALSALEWQRMAIDDGDWLRLLGAHVAHLGVRHLLFNLLGLALLAELLMERWRAADLASLCVASALGTSLLLWRCEPGLQWYAGLSGLLHGLWGGAALSGWLGTRSRLHAGALAALVAKLIWLNPATGASADLPVVPAAHLYGAASGLAWATLIHAWRRLRHLD